MYAVIATGGKQYRVEKGEVLEIEKVLGDIGSDFIFDQVLLVVDKKETKIGTPTVANAVVKGKIIGQNKEKKVIAFKYKRRKTYRRKVGHRQPISVIQIEEIKV